MLAVSIACVQAAQGQLQSPHLQQLLSAADQVRCAHVPTPSWDTSIAIAVHSGQRLATAERK